MHKIGKLYMNTGQFFQESFFSLSKVNNHKKNIFLTYLKYCTFLTQGINIIVKPRGAHIADFEIWVLFFGQM